LIGEDRRISAQTRSWEQAEAKARHMADGKPTASLDRKTVASAVAAFLEDKRIQNLKADTLSKLETIFRKQLGEWCRNSAIVYLDELTLAQLEKFRGSWRDDALARSKKQERVNGFFRYCIKHDWISKNPVADLSKVKVNRVPTDYFTRKEFDIILDTITLMYRDPRGVKGDGERLRQRLMAFVLLLRWSGLRIRDAVTLKRSRLTQVVEGGVMKDRLLLHTSKTGVHVTVDFPPEETDVAQRLRQLPNSNPEYFFWTGNGLPKSAVADWQRVLRKMFKLADLKKRAHPHMFRDTFAVEYLLARMSLEDVSRLLGHSSVKITERHYAPWVAARKKQLAESQEKAWEVMAKNRKKESGEK
jgi:integrase/recombinase XerD